MSKTSHWFKSLIASFYWLVYHGRWRVKDVFDDLYGGQQRSETFRRIFREVFGDEYAEEADPTGFLTMTDLRNIAERLRMGKDQALVDLACGLGGAGFWVARETGSRLTGIDISSTAIEKANQRIPDFGLEGRADFRVGDFAATGLPEASFDGAMSVDSLFLVPDKTGSVHETARVLRSGARFVVITWELEAAGAVKDYRPLLENAGFEIESYDETLGWESRQRAVYERILAEEAALINEMGETTARVWVRDARAEMPRLPHMRRVLVAARKI
ncbi:MAG: class I SAM-dependent methyltransferase [Pirellulales bacterium]|nr:class I SAM-dependent methyltransferase [Pirellulales bacterium]